MRGRHIAALGLTAALGIGATTVAVGQGTGGTLGPKAQGSTTLQVRIGERAFRLHCADTNVARRCQRQRAPRVGSIAAGTVAVFQGDERVGRAYSTNVITRRARGRTSDLFLATFVLRDGTLTLQGATEGMGASSIPSTITGGTGAYAGARGFATEQAVGEAGGELRIDLRLTFIP